MEISKRHETVGGRDCILYFSMQQAPNQFHANMLQKHCIILYKRFV